MVTEADLFNFIRRPKPTVLVDVPDVEKPKTNQRTYQKKSSELPPPILRSNSPHAGKMNQKATLSAQVPGKCVKRLEYLPPLGAPAYIIIFKPDEPNQ